MYHFDYAPYDEQCMEISLDLLSHLGAILIPISDMTRTAWGSEINLELQESSCGISRSNQLQIYHDNGKRLMDLPALDFFCQTGKR